MISEAALARLNDQELARANEIAAKLYGEPGWIERFITRVKPHQPPPAHILPFIRRLEDAPRKPLRLVVEVPPRHAKTTTMAGALAAWMERFPGDGNGYYTYSDRKARSESRKINALARAAGIPLNEEIQAAAEWRLTGGGGLLAGGAGSGLTGYGISGLMCVDDPYKNRKEAESGVVRDHIWDWFNDVAFTRDEGCSFVVMHTRWHEDDLIGRLIKEGWEELRLPAYAEEDDVLGRAIGEALWPDIFPVRRLKRIEKQIGAFRWASLYQQRPRPRGAKLFGQEHYYDPQTVDFSGCVMAIGADTAGTKKTSSDSSSLTAVRVRNAREPKDKWIGYVVDNYNEQVTVPQFARDLRGFQAKNDGAIAYVESAGVGESTYQTVKDSDPSARVAESPARESKFQRFQLISAMWNDGRLLVPLGPDSQYPWRKGFLARVQSLTGVGEEEDDDGDSLAHAVNNVKPPPEVYKPRMGGKARE